MWVCVGVCGVVCVGVWCGVGVCVKLVHFQVSPLMCVYRNLAVIFRGYKCLWFSLIEHLPRTFIPTNLILFYREITSVHTYVLMLCLHAALQGYPTQLLPMIVSGVPSIHICMDFIPELLAQPQIDKQVCGCVCGGCGGVCVCCGGVGVCVCCVGVCQLERVHTYRNQ